jgi:hypothetical protein
VIGSIVSFLAAHESPGALYAPGGVRHERDIAVSYDDLSPLPIQEQPHFLVPI